MATVDVRTAEADLSHLIERACAGEAILIIADGDRMVRMEAVQRSPVRRERGSLESQVFVSDTFFDPLPPDELMR
jgi:antitoxin (DNA-binding transcriptional repressor) of toxin-antitoxin stability system